MTAGHVVFKGGKLVHDRDTCKCPVVDFPDQHIPGQLDALDAIDEEEAEDARQP